MTPVRASDLNARQLAVLRHIGLYRIGLYPVLSRMFFDGKPPGGVLGKMAKEDTKISRPALIKVQSIRSRTKARINKHFSYATLRSTALPLVDLPIKTPAKRTESIGGSAIETHIGVAWFCCCGETRRYRLERVEAEKLMGLGKKDLPDMHFFAATESDFEHPAILRLYHATTKPADAVKRLREHLRAAIDVPQIRAWLEAGDFGFGVMVVEPKRVDDYRDEFEKVGLMRDARIVVDVGPSSQTLWEVAGGDL